MVGISRICTLVLGGALLASTGMASAARADVVFANRAGQDIVFIFRCAGGTYDRWRVDAGDRIALYCENGASTASVRIVTDRDNGDQAVVRGTVYDGHTYRIEYDADGDVSFRRVM